MKPWKLSGDLEVDSCGASNGNLVHISDTAIIPQPAGIKSRYIIGYTIRITDMSRLCSDLGAMIPVSGQAMVRTCTLALFKYIYCIYISQVLISTLTALL